MKTIESVSKFRHVVAFVLAAILVFSGFGFLQGYPLASGLSLIAFSLLYFLAAWVTRQGYHVYGGVLLFTTGYCLLLSRIGFSSEMYPALSIPIAFALFLLQSRLRKAANSLVAQVERSMGLVILFFACRVLLALPVYVRDGLAGAIIPLTVFSLICLLHYLGGRKLFSQVGCLLLFSVAYLLSLYWMRPIPKPYYGLFLILLSMGLMALGSRYHDRVGFNNVRPLYAVGQILSLLAFFYAAGSPAAVLTCLAVFSFHYVGFSRSVSLKQTAWKYPEFMLYKSAFALANVAAAVYVVLLFAYRFTPPLAVLLTSLGYVFIYGRVAHGRRRTILESRSQYVYLTGLFLTVSYLVLLGILLPRMGTWVKNVLLAIPLVVGVLYCAHILAQSKKAVLAASASETAIAICCVCLFLPSIGGEPAGILGVVLGVCFLACFIVFWRLSRQRALLYAVPAIGSYLYYHIVGMAGVPEAVRGLYLVPGGVLAGVTAVVLERRGSSVSSFAHFAWIFLAGISIACAVKQAVALAYVTSFWAVCFLAVSQTGAGWENSGNTSSPRTTAGLLLNWRQLLSPV